MEVNNETPFDEGIADWQIYLDDVDVMIAALRQRREFALNQMEKFNLERIRYLGERAESPTVQLSNQ